MYRAPSLHLRTYIFMQKDIDICLGTEICDVFALDK